MKNDPNFDPIIILNKIPESLDKQERRFENVFDTSLQLLNTRYNNVFLNYYNGEYIDYSDKIDIAIFHMLHPSHYQNYMSPPYLLSKNVLCIWIPYYINVSKSQTNEIQSKSLRYKNIDYMWKIFLDNFLTYKELIMHNTYFYGYPKLDNFAEKEKNNCITIILAPHQDLNGACFCGNFLNTYNLYLEIPSIFTKIKFIFRPHPLWYPNLRIAWGEKKAQDYLNSVTSLPNVLYSTEDDYYQIFANSNALIHDCATFLAEYFVTKNPQFYLQDNKEIYEKYFNHFGMKCLENVYIGSQIDEVVDFIKNVVIQGKDYMQQSRIDFMKSTKLVDNYPNISKRIFEDIKNDLFN